ncbi:MAG: pre-peptidase C-terminal domain-containing protein [Campylobacterales bacterium]|nr:pre-peptidase C-terminal domain-containing protein [Campylobacterales bacterium]
MKRVSIFASMLLVSVGFSDMFARDLRALISDDYPNTQSSAQEITLNSTMNGSIEMSGNVDWFKFTLQNDDGIIINNAGNSNGSYPYIVLYNSNLTQLAKETVSNNDTVATKNLTAGTYYIKVYIYDSGITNYHFDLKINGELANTFYPHTGTVTYCKNNPSACGISLTSSSSSLPTVTSNICTLLANNPPPLPSDFSYSYYLACQAQYPTIMGIAPSSSSATTQ